MMLIEVANNIKKLRSQGYNYNFRLTDGFFVRWGITPDDDPDFSPYGPELLDIEVSTICHGVNGKPCPWCYKSNTAKGKNMSFDTFKIILDKIPLTLTQTAFGVGDLNGNPDLWKMMEYCRTNPRNKVIPNLTINGWKLTPEDAGKLSKVCGAVSVSRYPPKDVCYDAVKLLTGSGLKQTNIHMLVAEETYEDCIEVLNDFHTDPRLSSLNAIVFLILKPKGKRNAFHRMSDEKFNNLVKTALELKVPMGFDSCSAYRFLNGVRGHKEFERFKMFAEPCESGIFSSYINVDGIFFPCSFVEGEKEWKEGIDVVRCENFLKDIWCHKKTKQFRDGLIDSALKNDLGCRMCPQFLI